MQTSLSFTSFLKLISWADSFLYCKEYKDLNQNHKLDGQPLNGSFRITTFYKNPEAWFSCGKNIALPELISHYLHLNLTFINPNDDFDRSWGWYNGTHSSGPLRMLVNNQIDYIINDIYMDSTLWHPNGIIAMTTALDDNYKINFVTKKHKIIKKFGNYNLAFDLPVWLMIISLILLISAISCLNKMIRRITKYDVNLKFSWKLYFNLIIDNFSLLFSKHPSFVLSKMFPRQLIMAVIPLLSILTINLINSCHYSHAIQPVTEWCDSLDCFINHKPHGNHLKRYTFYQYEDVFTLKLMKDDKQLAQILNRTEIRKRTSNFEI